MTDHRSFFLDESLHDYVIAHTTPADPIRQSLTEATAAFGPWARMQVADDQAALLSALVSAIRPTLAVEIGTFTGSSSLAIARALPVHPSAERLLCCDVSDEWTAIARRHWEAAGVDDRIEEAHQHTLGGMGHGHGGDIQPSRAVLAAQGQQQCDGSDQHHGTDRPAPLPDLLRTIT